MPFSYRDEIKDLDDLARKQASGCFAQLSDGYTHYELSNPHARETVVLVHGFSVPYFIFDPTFAFLTGAGFRVLRYDLLGRGFSDRPDTSYDIHLFVRQLRDLLDALQLTQPVSLVGVSMGGPITAAFTARFPERVEKLVLIDPAGAKPFALAQVLQTATLPGIGEALVGALASVRMAKWIAASPFDRERIGEFGPRYLVQMQYKGFKRALLSTIRSDMLGSFLDVYRQVGATGKPVLLFWGRRDHTIPFRHSDLLRAAISNLQFCLIENSGHIPHYETPEQVNPVLLHFLRSARREE